MTKKELRQHLRQVIAGVSPEQLHARSHLVCSQLISSREYSRAEIVMVFLSLPNEIDTSPLVLDAWRARKRVLAPRVSWEQRRMLPIEIRSLSDDISESPIGIREPQQGMPIPVGEIDLVLVPGLGFDRAGNRIGRGRGFYDRFLAHPDFRGIACGLAMAEQLVAEVPTDELDMRVDMLVTDQETIRFKSKAST